jgi:hypothetical protein
MGGGNIGGGSVEMTFYGGGNDVTVQDPTAVPTVQGGHSHRITVKFPNLPTPIGNSGKHFEVTVTPDAKIEFRWQGQKKPKSRRARR